MVHYLLCGSIAKLGATVTGEKVHAKGFESAGSAFSNAPVKRQDEMMQSLGVLGQAPGGM